MELGGRLLPHPNSRFSLRKGYSTLALTDAFAFSASASSLPGSSFRRRPGRITTRHSTSNPRFSYLLPTPW